MDQDDDHSRRQDRRIRKRSPAHRQRGDRAQRQLRPAPLHDQYGPGRLRRLRRLDRDPELARRAERRVVAPHRGHAGCGRYGAVRRRGPSGAELECARPVLLRGVARRRRQPLRLAEPPDEQLLRGHDRRDRRLLVGTRRGRRRRPLRGGGPGTRPQPRSSRRLRHARLRRRPDALLAPRRSIGHHRRRRRTLRHLSRHVPERRHQGSAGHHPRRHGGDDTRHAAGHGRHAGHAHAPGGLHGGDLVQHDDRRRQAVRIRERTDRQRHELRQAPLHDRGRQSRLRLLGRFRGSRDKPARLRRRRMAQRGGGLGRIRPEALRRWRARRPEQRHRRGHDERVLADRRRQPQQLARRDLELLLQRRAGRVRRIQRRPECQRDRPPLRARCTGRRVAEHALRTHCRARLRRGGRVLDVIHRQHRRAGVPRLPEHVGRLHSRRRFVPRDHADDLVPRGRPRAGNVLLPGDRGRRRREREPAVGAQAAPRLGHRRPHDTCQPCGDAGGGERRDRHVGAVRRQRRCDRIRGLPGRFRRLRDRRRNAGRHRQQHVVQRERTLRRCALLPRHRAGRGRQRQPALGHRDGDDRPAGCDRPERTGRLHGDTVQRHQRGAVVECLDR